ncbi:MAG: DJ-1/PfpI family protein [Candidatus Altiarchaeota archaeon]
MSAKKVLMVLAPLNFRDKEYKKPRKVLEDAGYRIYVTSPGFMGAKSVMGLDVSVDIAPSEVDVLDYDAVIFVSGPGISRYFKDPELLKIAKEATKFGLVVGAICISPVILANAGVLKGKKVTAWSSSNDFTFLNKMRTAGANVRALDHVVADGKLITATGPDYAQEFGEKILEVLTK